MTESAVVWNLLFLLGGLVVIAAIAIMIARVRHARKANPPAGDPEPYPTDADAFLDSSHIGLEPLLGTKNLAHYGADTAMNGKDTKNRRR